MKELPATIRHQGKDVCVKWYQRKVGPLPEWFTNPNSNQTPIKRCDFSDRCADDARWKRLTKSHGPVFYCDHHKNQMVNIGKDDPSDYTRL